MSTLFHLMRYDEFLMLLNTMSTLLYLTRYIEDIYFFEVNTKYISSSAVKKISIFHECVAQVKILIFYRMR